LVAALSDQGALLPHAILVNRDCFYKVRYITLMRIICAFFLLFGSVWAQTSWTPRESGTSQGLNSVIWANGQLLAVGDSGKILVSPDGVEWTPRSSGVKNTLSSVAFGGGQYVAVGDGVILTSVDGITWMSQGSGKAPVSGDGLNVLHAVFWGENKFVAVGWAGVILTSTDGLSWTTQNSGSTGYNLISLTWTGSQWVAGAEYGYILTSPDGENWTTIYLSYGNFPVHPRSLIWTGTEIVGFNGLDYLTSSDGNTWSHFNIGSLNSSGSISAIAWTGYRLVAVGPRERIATTIDGTEWIKPSINSKGYFRAITWTGSQLVAVGQYGVVFTSPMDSVVALRANPANDDLVLRQTRSGIHVRFPEGMGEGSLKISIFDMSGKIRTGMRVYGSRTVDIETDLFEKGVYTLEITGANVRRIKRFSVTR
jgi:hypothetical protein